MNLSKRGFPLALLCDPNIQRLEQTRKQMQNYFYLEVVSDFADAVQLLKNKSYDLVCIDKEIGMELFSCFRFYPQPRILAFGEKEKWTESEANQLELVGIQLKDMFQYPLLDSDLQEISQEVGGTTIINKPSNYNEYTEAKDYQSSGLQSSPLNPDMSRGYDQVNQGYQQAPAGWQDQSQIYMRPDHPASSYKPILPAHIPREYPQNNSQFNERRLHEIQRGVYSFYSPKGGVGKTTVSTNMALALQKLIPDARICLIDFDIFFGNVASLLNIDPSGRTVLDWVNLPEHMDGKMVEESLIKHSSGLYVLPAPTRASEEEFITAEISEKVVSQIKQYFDLVFIDLGPTLRDSTMIAFQHSEKIFLISDLDRLTLKDNNAMQSEFKGMEIPVWKVEMILNNITGSEGYTLKDVENNMHYTILGSLSHDPKMKKVINRQYLPIVISEPKSTFSKEIVNLTQKIFQLNGNSREKKSFFSFLPFIHKKKGVPIS